MGFFCSFVATEKKRDGLSWFLLGFLFSLLALIAIAGCPSLSSNQPKAAGSDVYRSKDPDLDRILSQE